MVLRGTLVEKILLLIEGAHTEFDFFRVMNEKFWKVKGLEIVPFCCNIYSLYSLMEDYDFDIDIEKAVCLCGSCSEKEKEIIRRSKFSTKYLVFDLDLHDDSCGVSETLGKVEKMLDYFDNDSDQGLLFLNYPMFEAIKEPYCKENAKNLTFDLKKSKGYKDYTDKNCRKIDFDKLSYEKYIGFIFDSVSMANFIITSTYGKPGAGWQNDLSSRSIFSSQESLYSKEEVMRCFNGSMLYPLYYFGERLFKRILLKNNTF